jgi:hypothetical protein
LASHLNRQLPRTVGESGPDSHRTGPFRADLARAIFFRKCSILLIDLQTLKFHRNCSVHANEVIQISLGSLDDYLSDGIGPMILGAM